MNYFSVTLRIQFGFIIGLLSVLALTSPDAYTESKDAEWRLYGREYNNQRYSLLSQINDKNVHGLKLNWRFNTGKIGSFQSSPLIADGVMYVTTPFNDVLALSADSGELIWRYEHELRSNDYCCGPANRGPAIANGKVYTVTIDSRLIALDQITGELIWDKAITDTNAGTGEILEPLLGVKELKGAKQTGQTGYSTNLAPQVYDNKIFVGITGAGYGLHLNIEENEEQILSVGGLSGGGHGLRGFLVAYDLDSGDEIWRWYSVPENNWQGDWSKKTSYGVDLNRHMPSERQTYEQYKDTWRYGGGSIYTTPAIDPALGLIYIGTGNPSPQMDDSTRPGDNLHTVSLVALEIETGKLRWHYQQVPHDRWGYDVASPPVLFDFDQDGKTVPAVGQASKLGWFFIHDRLTGKLLKMSEPFVKQENLFARPTAKGVRIVPGTLGAASWSPVAYHPELKQVYIPGIYQPSMFFSRTLTPEPGKPWASYTFFQKSKEPDWGSFTAIDTNSGKISWQVKVDDPMVGGAIATAGNLVFTGEGNGYFKAYNATDGKVIWQYKSKFGVNAPPVTYMLKGKQYIAVAAGGNKLFGYKTGDAILVFSLD
ncbi:MAG: PQQ-binding-like beta-propeller repeat protein [Gammaproteobacteria bacterium]|nr:PQQ-binding-like beta-propeller repeat protein [Gammaproteobacteria bacterium]